jgi:hypothetical protein
MPSSCGTRRWHRFSETDERVFVLGKAVNRVADADLENFPVRDSTRALRNDPRNIATGVADKVDNMLV